MSIRELASGSFQARLMIDGVSHSATFSTEDEARDWILVTRARATTGSLPRRMTVQEYATRWLGTYDAGPAATRVFHETNLRLYLVPAIGRRAIAEVTPTDIARMLNGVRTNVSAAKAGSVYRTASALFRAAFDDDVVVRVPVRSRKHKPKRQVEPQVFLERDQAKGVLARLSGWKRDTALVQLALGARFGEVAGLTPHDVDLAARRVTIRRRFYRDTVRATKNHRLRTLELPTVVVPTLERLVEELGHVEPIPPLGDREVDAAPFHRRWLIQTSTGRPPEASMFNKALKAACVETGAPQVSSHGLRHTYVSWMIDDGHSADKVAFWIGDTPATVRAVYAHMLEASSVPAAATIDEALTGF